MNGASGSESFVAEKKCSKNNEEKEGEETAEALAQEGTVTSNTACYPKSCWSLWDNVCWG